MGRWQKGVLRAFALLTVSAAAAAGLPSDAESQYQPTPASPSPTGILGSIGGRVTDTVTGGGISNVKVVARTGQLFFNAMTDTDGRYVLQGLPPSTYALRFSRSVAYEFEPNPFPDLNYTPAPLVVELKEGKNVVDANLQAFYWGTKVPSIMTCGNQSCGYKVTVFDFDDPATATDPYCGTDACDGPEDFNKEPTNRLYRVVELGFTLNGASANPVPFTYVTSFAYDFAGRCVRKDGPRTDVNDVLEYDYFAPDSPVVNDRGRLHSVRGWVTDTTFLQTVFDNYDVSGFPKKIEYPDGMTVVRDFDALGRVTKMTFAGRSFREFFFIGDKLKWVRETDGGYQNFYYHQNELGELSHVIRSWYPAFDDNDVPGPRHRTDFDQFTNIVTEESYDAAGALSFVLKHQAGPPVDGHKRVFVNTSSFADDYFDGNGNVYKTVDALGNETRFVHDSFGRLQSVAAPVNDTQISMTFYQYDNHGNLSGTIDALGRPAVLVYDDMDRLVFAERPDSGSTRFWYNESSNLVGKTDQRNVTITYAYDGLGRRTRDRLPHGNDLPAGVVDTMDTEYVYDEGGYAGHLTTVFDDAGFTRFRYDATGRLVSTAVYGLGLDTTPGFRDAALACFGRDRFEDLSPVPALDEYSGFARAAMECPGLAAETTVDFNLYNKAARITYPSGRVVEYEYCEQPPSCEPGQPRVVKANGVTHYEANQHYYDHPETWPMRPVVTYDSFYVSGPPREYDTLGIPANDYQDLTVSVGLDLDGRRTSFSARTIGCIDRDNPECNVFDRTYAYDNSNKVVAINDNGHFKYSANLEYNARGWMKAAIYSFKGRNEEQHTSFWEYDGLGQRTADEYGEYRRGSFGELVAKIDQARNQVLAFEYDATGNVSRVVDADFDLRYSRDAYGRVVLVEATSSTGVKEFIRLFRNFYARIGARLDTSPTLGYELWQVHGYIDSRRLLWTMGPPDPPDFIYAHGILPIATGDSRSGILRPVLRPMTLDVAEITGWCNTQRDVFGYKIPDGVGPDGGTSYWGYYCTTTNFPGQTQLVGIDMLDNANRLYHTLLGQYLEPDPFPLLAPFASYDGEFSRYGYANNDPLYYFDSTGLYVCGKGCRLKKECDPRGLCQEGKDRECFNRAQNIRDETDKTCVQNLCTSKTHQIQCNRKECAEQGFVGSQKFSPSLICQDKLSWDCPHIDAFGTVAHEFAHECHMPGDSPEPPPDFDWGRWGNVPGLTLPGTKKDTCQSKCPITPTELNKGSLLWKGNPDCDALEEKKAGCCP